MTVRKRRAKPPRRREGERKSEATRRHILERALALFQDRGVDGTTMRDIADAAGLSLGATYYYFPSKEALVFAFYEENQHAAEEIALSGTLPEQIASLLHARLRSIHDQRHMLGTIVQRLIDPGDPLSAFSAQTQAIRARSIELYARPFRDTGLPPATIQLLAHALWMFQLALMLVYIKDDTPGQKRTHGLVDEAVGLLAPLVPMLGTPIGAQLVQRVVGALGRAGLAMS